MVISLFTNSRMKGWYNLHFPGWKIASLTLPFHLLLLFIFCVISGVKVISRDTTAIYGENTTLFCQLTDTEDQLTLIIWKKRTQENPEEKAFFSIRAGNKIEHLNGLEDRLQFIGNFAEKNGSIQLLRMRLLDEGIYTCIFVLISSGPFETNINATVFARPVGNVKEEAPVAGYLEAMLASCFASDAWPAAEVMWRLGELQKNLRTETNQTVNLSGSITVVSYLLGVPLKHLNNKNVQCVVKHNTLGKELVLNYKINIHYPPESVVIIPDSPTNTKEFICKVDSNPEPNSYTWTREDKHAIYYEGNRLPVPNLSSDLNGLYICNTSNQYGSSFGSLYVSVYKESSTVCWGLFGFFTCSAVLASVVGAIFKFKPEWIPVPRDSDNR